MMMEAACDCGHSERNLDTKELDARLQGALDVAAPSVPIHKKLYSWDFYHKVLGSPRYVVAPMVDASELPFRMLCRKYGAQLCYTPMFHSKNFALDAKYRKKEFSTCPEDRPLIVQFCANDPDLLLQAAKYVEDHCDAVDLNLGCPQNIAKRGNYGAFLLDKPHWPLLRKMVSTLHINLKVPVTVKIRLLPDLEDTIALARLLEESGAQLLCVHGRTRENKGANLTPADWDAIRRVRESVSIPVISNGSIDSFDDIEPCLKATGACGVMAAVATLYNPALYSNTTPDTISLAYEYIDYCVKYPAKAKMMRGHLCKLLKKQFEAHDDLRERLLVNVRKPHEVREIVHELEHRINNGVVAEGVQPRLPNAMVKPKCEAEDDLANFESGLFTGNDEEDYY